MAGSERTKMFEWSRIDFYSLLLTRVATYLDKGLYEYLKGTVLRGLGAEGIYDESASRLDEFFGSSGLAGVIEKAAADGILPPFSDAGPKRRVAWEQLGARWFVEWNNDYESAQAAESFCATLQILLEDLRSVELSLLPSDVHLNIILHDDKLKIQDDSDNERILLNIALPRTAGGGTPEMAVLVQGVAAAALNLLSAMPQKQFLELYEQRARAGLLDKFFPFAPYDRLFREFYLERQFKEHYDHSRGVKVGLGSVVPKTDAALSGPSGPHPAYKQTDSERQIKRRYEKCLLQLKYTLPRLKEEAEFRHTIAELRKQGWKDWHILQAIATMRINYIINEVLPRSSSMAELEHSGKSLYTREEQPSDPVIPLNFFTVDALKHGLTLSQAATLKGLGFEMPQRTPNFSGLNRFLERFKYWTDDIPHEPIF